MNDSSSASLLSAVEVFIKTPTSDNREKLLVAADGYREHWIVAQASLGATSKKTASHRATATTYDRQLEVARIVGGIPVKLALQERTSTTADQSWWTLSWRTQYSRGGSNRRFYITKDGCWKIPAVVALEMIEEMESLGGLDEKYFDHRRRPRFETLISGEMTPTQRAEALAKVTGPEEDWGPDPFVVITFDPNDSWKKVMIVDTSTDTATFRSITEDADYMPKKVLRPGEGWWLDNSMMDANVQQTRAFYSNLRDYLARK